jgi:hypothetical protein
MKNPVTLFIFFIASSLAFGQIPSSGNILWLKADMEVFKDNGVTLAPYGQLAEVWKDQSGNGNDFTQHVFGNRPQLVVQSNAFCGKPALRFDIGRHTYMSSALKSAGPKTIFIVFKIPFLVNTPQTLLSIKGAGNTYTEILGTDNPSYMPVSYIADIPGSISGGTMIPAAGNNVSYSNNGNILAMTYNGGSISTPSSYTMNYDNSPSTVNASGLFGRLMYDTTSIGGRAPEQNYCFLSGDIAEIIVYNRVLSSTEISDVETYLISKYGFFNTCTPLEVKMIDFTAIVKGDGTLLKWEISNEVNAIKYVVQRSTDNVNWDDIGNKIPGHSNERTNKYDLTDLFPKEGLNYYRVKTETKDGNYVFSQVKSIKWESNTEGKLWIIPNPAADYFIVSSKAKEALTIIITDGNGRLEKRINRSSNTEIDIRSLPAGIHFLMIETKTGIKNLKMIKK